MLAANTLYDKLWNSHVVLEENGHPAVLYVDLQWLHDGTFRRAFELLEERGLSVARPAQNIAVTDHCLPTVRPLNPLPPVVSGLVAACKRHGIRVFGPQDSEQGIVHIIGPEQGLTLPGMTVICADSHTTTHGALGALSLVVGTTQTLHALSTQCVLQRRAKTMRINLEGSAQRGVTAKDVVLALIRRHGIAVASGFAIEYSGTSVRAMSIAQRMTLCNMGAELGARTALIAPDEKTFEYLEGRRFSPQAYAAAVERWRHLRSDEGARFDAEIAMDVRDVAPMVTWGTTPEMAISVDEPIPSPRSSQESEALRYMGFKPGLTPKSMKVDQVFIGSCTNSQIEDLRLAAGILKGRQIDRSVRLLVVPGSQSIKRCAEHEGLDQIFLSAGADWGHPGCSLCVGMNGELAPPGAYVASTSNRNFPGRQGPGVRTLLMSPLTAAACALTGYVSDPRPLLSS